MDGYGGYGGICEDIDAYGWIWLNMDGYGWMWKDTDEFGRIREDMGVAATESFCQTSPAFTKYKTPSASP